MNKYFLILLACFFVNIAYAQNSSTVSLSGSNSNNEDTPILNPAQTLTTEEVKPSRLESVKNNFSRSILTSPNEYAGVVLTYMPGINNEGNDYQSFSGNYLFSSLWGIKVISEKSNFSNVASNEYYESVTEDNSVKSLKIGANKLFPAYSNFAFEAGIFYERGKVESNYISDYSYEESSDSKSFSAGNALVGINFFTGSFVAGVQFQQRFASSSLTVDSSNRFNKATTLTGNIGICF
jgi:hypothetical protein